MKLLCAWRVMPLVSVELGGSSNALYAAATDKRCITVSDVVIIGGAEALGTKKLCKSPGSARYDVIEVAQTVYGAASTQAAFERASDPELRALHLQIEALRGQVMGDGDGANTAGLALLVAQGKFVAALASQDRSYAEAIAQFRDAVVDLAATPAGVAALGQYNAGDEAGALAILDRLHEANDAARQMQSNIASAAEARRIAGLALDARNKGKLTTAAVIARYEAVTRLDPGVFQDWLYLSRLNQEAGRVAEARRTITHAQGTAGSDRERALALAALGDLLIEHGDVAGAERAYSDCLAISRKAAVGKTVTAEESRDLTVSLNKLGDAHVAQGDLQTGLQHFVEARKIIRARAEAGGATDFRSQRDLTVSLDRVADVLAVQSDLAGADREYIESLRIRRKIAFANPTSSQAQRDVSVSLVKFGDLRGVQHDYEGAETAYRESLEIRRRLAADDPTSVLAQRDVSVSLDRLGDARAEHGDFAGAGTAYEDELTIARRLASTADSSNAEARRDLAVALSKVAEMRERQHDEPGSLKANLEVLQIAQAGARADPTNSEAQRDLWVVQFKLAGKAGSGVSWREVADRMYALSKQGMLAPSDRAFLDQAISKAALSHRH